nr:MAG TPA: hypothetical protein [Caudoviricetes sp.]
MKRAAAQPSCGGSLRSTIFLTSGKRSGHSPGSPKHSSTASCCSGVSALCRGL